MNNEPSSELPLAVVTGERIPPAAPQPTTQRATARENRVIEISAALEPAYAKAGTLELTEQESKDLVAPFEDSIVEKRPHDGLYYIPHIHISDRLTRIFGPGRWTMLRRWENIENNTIFCEWVMIVRGVYIGESIGGHQYHPNNPKQNYSDALESTRGEALRRIAAKYLACGSQVWNPAYCRGLNAPKGPVSIQTTTQAPPPAKAPIKPPQSAGSGVVEVKEAKHDWSAFPIPFGKNAGKALGDIPRATLWGFWKNFVVETSYKGKARSEEQIERDTTFRTFLDQAGVYYRFDEPQNARSSNDNPPQTDEVPEDDVPF